VLALASQRSIERGPSEVFKPTPPATMQTPTLNREQVREIDRRAIQEYGMSGLVLMENAGRGVADKICQFGIYGRVVICCGTGNNGGDGFVIARHLDLRAIRVEVLVFTAETTVDEAERARAKSLSGDAAVNFEILRKTDVPIDVLTSGSRLGERIKRSSFVVDALLGTGARGEVRAPLDKVIEEINQCGSPVVAVDVPSGLDCDTGEPTAHTIKAVHTCTFVAPKPGFFVAGAEQYTGQVHVLDIGAPRKLVDESLRAAERRRR
jgi:NAD(P)H-hydrate epimerase